MPIEIMNKLTRAEKNAVFGALKYYCYDASNMEGETGLRGKEKKILESAMHKLEGIL